MKWVTSAAPTVMAGLVWGFFCQEGFRIFFASSLLQGSAVWSQIEARSWPSIPWQRETAMAGALSRPKPPEAGAEAAGGGGRSRRRRGPKPPEAGAEAAGGGGRSRRRRGPKARLYEGPAIAENRPPRSVGRFAIARCSTCLPFLDECGRGWISRRS